MKLFDKSFGIDFREDKLILTFLKKFFGRITLIDYGIYPIAPISRKEEREAQLLSLINQFALKNQINRGKVSISILREKVIGRFIKLPVSTKENLRKVIEYEASKYTPFERGEVYFDYNILKEDKKWIHLFAVFVKKTEVDSYLSLLKKIGIHTHSVQIPTTSAINLFFYERKIKNHPFILIDFEDSFFEINLINGKNDWKESLCFPLPEEEKELEIIDIIRRSLRKNESLPHITSFVYGLGASEERIRSIKKEFQVSFPSLDRINLKKLDLFPSKIYPSIGIPLQGLIRTKVDINLLPLEMRKKVREIWRPLFFTFIIIALLLSTAWGLGIFIRYRNELNIINSEIKKRKPAIESLDNLRKKTEDLKKNILEFEKIRGEEVSKVLILKELTRILPSNAWIWNLKYKGGELEISGFAESASDLIPILDKSPLFEKVEFLAPVTKERQIGIEPGKERERFKIKAKIERGR